MLPKYMFQMTTSSWPVVSNPNLRRQENWQTQAYPYGSEFGFDTTGQEEVVIWNMYFGNMTAAKRTVDHILSYMRSSPTWAYNGGARSWGDAGTMNFRDYFGPFLTQFSAPPHPTCVVCYVLLGAHADRVLIGAWNPIL